MFEAIHTSRTFESAVEQVAVRVRGGELRSGDRLPSERELAAIWQISRPTVREAVKVLADAGVLSVSRGPAGGITVVSDFAPASLIARSRELRIEEVGAVLEARRVIEIQVAKLAAGRARPADFDELQSTIDRQRELVALDGSVADEDRFLSLDMRFHLAVVKAADNLPLAQMMQVIIRDIEIARDMAMHVPLVPEWAVDIHVRTLSALMSGDLVRVEDVMDEHLSGLESTWVDETGRRLQRAETAFLFAGSRKST